MNMYKIMSTGLGGVAFVALSACSSHSTLETKEQPIVMEKAEAPKASNVAYAKPGASVSFTHNYDGKTEPGFVEDFQVFIQEEYDAGTLSVSVNASEGLRLSSGTSQKSFSMDGSAVRVINISASAQNPGKYYVNLQATADAGNGQAMKRSYAVAIYVGDPKLYPKMNQGMKIEDTGEGGKIIVMDAEEKIGK